MSFILALICAFCAFIYLGLCGFFFVTQRSFIYFPCQKQNYTVDQIQVNTGQALVQLSASNLKSKRAILYFGGNAEDVSVSLPEYSRRIADVAIYMVHYRGYGHSTGNPSEKGLRHDALAIYRHLKKPFDILVIGRSLGTSLAIDVAAEFEPKGLLLITPFDSVQAIAQRVVPFLPIRLLLRDSYLSIDFAQRSMSNTDPVASNDELIPKENTMRLIKKFPEEVATLQVIQETDHNSISNSTLYWSSVCHFINKSFGLLLKKIFTPCRNEVGLFFLWICLGSSLRR